MKNFEATARDVDFNVDLNNLYREEAITDMKVASIRRLVPIKPDGSDDQSRTAVFVGSTQLMTPEGPLPIQTKLPANNLDEAFREFPKAMQRALTEMLQRLEQLQLQHQQQQQKQKRESSRIIVPGR
jgi:ribosomal protein S21